MNWTDARGSTSLIAAFALLGVAGATAAAVEMSRVSAAKTALQDLADTTALRTARADARGEQAEGALAEGAEALALSLMKEQAPGATEAQASVTFRQDRPAVTVKLSHKAGLFGHVSAEATALEEPDAPVCLLVLDPVQAGAWSVGGSSVVSAQDCAAQVNSASARALNAGGAARVSMLRTLVVGRGGPVRGFAPAPRYDQPLLADPYAEALPWPRPGHCDHTDVEVKKASVQLQPGVYCGGLTLGSGGAASLAPGVYVLKDGPLKLASQSRLDASSGVTFVMVGRGGFVEARSGASMNLKAPTSGGWAGFVVAQAPDAQQGQSSVVIGGGDVQVDGMVYLPAQRMLISGGGEGFVAGLVVRTLDMRGNGRLRLAPGVHAPMLPGMPRLEDPEGPPPPPPPGEPG